MAVTFFSLSSLARREPPALRSVSLELGEVIVVIYVRADIALGGLLVQVVDRCPQEV